MLNSTVRFRQSIITLIICLSLVLQPLYPVFATVTPSQPATAQPVAAVTTENTLSSSNASHSYVPPPPLNAWDAVYAQLSVEMIDALAALLEVDPLTPPDSENPWSRLAKLKEDPNGIDLKNTLEVGEKLRDLRRIRLPIELFEAIDTKWVELYRQRAMAEHPSAYVKPCRSSIPRRYCFV